MADHQPATTSAVDARPVTDTRPPADQTPRRPDPQTPTEGVRWTRNIPMTLALLLVSGVWIAGCVWSFEEQTSFARFKHFHLPWLLPLVIDGLAISMAAVAYAASLDARPAVFARLGTAIAVALSASSNAAWAWERSAGDDGTIALAIVVPVLANLAFEVLLSELRRRVMRRRGIPAPLKIPMPRLYQAALSPWSTFWEWRRLVLRATALQVAFDAAEAAAKAGPDEVRQTPPAAPVRTPRKQTPSKRQTRSGQTPDPQTPAKTTDPVTGVWAIAPTVDRDAADLAKLREQFARQTPSINDVQRVVGGGRTRAIRLRSLHEQQAHVGAQPDVERLNGHDVSEAIS